MKKLFAIITTHNNGYDPDKEAVKALGVIGEKFEVEHVSVGRSMSSFHIVGQPNSFNTVNFNFVDEDGNDVNIYDNKDYWDF